MTQQTEFVPYEQALELKELGFDEECIASYTQTLRFNVLEQNGLMWHTVTNEKKKEYERHIDSWSVRGHYRTNKKTGNK